MRGLGYRIVKRLADVVFSAAILLLLLPVLLVVALAVRLNSPGPALYRADRVGKGGRRFRMLKFRTMVVNSAGPAITAADDPRITSVGHFLRRSKLDEIPQFWNVLRGEMSVVGPRPNVARFTDHYTEEQKHLLEAEQGVTDFSSLWFRRQEAVLEGTQDAEADYEARVAPMKTLLGNYYVDHVSLENDVKIFVATLFAVGAKVDPLWCFPPALRNEARALHERLNTKQTDPEIGAGADSSHA